MCQMLRRFAASVARLLRVAKHPHRPRPCSIRQNGTDERNTHDRAAHTRRDRGDEARGAVRRGDAGDAARRDEGRHEPARDRSARARPDPPRRRGVLLHRLPPLVRGEPVRQGHLHVGERRRAARSPLRLRAARRRPRLARLRGVDRRLGRRLGRLVRRRHASRRGPRAHRHDRAGTGCRDRRCRRRQPHRRHLARDRRRSPTPTATPSTPTSAATASVASCTATRTCRTTARPGAATRCATGLVVALEPWFLAHDRRARHRSRRLDAAQRRRLPRRALRAHRRDDRRPARSCSPTGRGSACA